MENFDKIKEVVIKCIKRHYPDCQVTLIDGNTYELNVHIFQTSLKEQLRCCEIIDDILKLCHIKTYFNIKVNGRSRMLIKLDSMTEQLQNLQLFSEPSESGFNRFEYEIPTPMIDGVYQLRCNTDPI